MRLLMVVLASSATAFQVVPRRVPSRLVVGSVASDQEEGYKSVDMKRAKDCAEHFGKCTTEEMEELRDNVHKERLQNFMFGGSGLTKPDEDALEHRLVEEELDLQLALLKEETPDPSLFPEAVPEEPDEMEALPHLKDHTVSHDVEEMIHKKQELLALEETVLEESNLEAFALCVAIIAMYFIPQLLHI